jgi:hypothetical protein
MADRPALGPSASRPAPDLVYLYEVGSEELAPALEGPQRETFDEEPETGVEKSLATPEADLGEALPYEVNSAASSGASEIAGGPDQKSDSEAKKMEQPSLFGDAGDSAQKPEA